MTVTRSELVSETKYIGNHIEQLPSTPMQSTGNWQFYYVGHGPKTAAIV